MSDDKDKITLFLESIKDEKLSKVMEIIVSYSQIDGDHHKSWCFDKIVREIVGDRYEEFIDAYCDGEDGPDTYEWDKGITP